MNIVNSYSSVLTKPTSLYFSLKRGMLPFVLFVLLGSPITQDLTVNTLSDAFWAVSCYVAMTLMIYHAAKVVLGHNHTLMNLIHRSKHHQVIFSALMGALPGCGGAIVVTTQFVSGRLGFASVVAVLVSTMGDAAFLLLAAKPGVGLMMVLMGVVIGSLTGMAVNALHRDDFLRPKVKNNIIEASSELKGAAFTKHIYNLQGLFWAVVIIPGTIIALLNSFQIDMNDALSLSDGAFEWIGALLLLFSSILWAFSRDVSYNQKVVNGQTVCRQPHPIQKTAQDTNFVTAWVVVAFLVFELSAEFTQVNFQVLFENWGLWLPFAGVLMGLLPGCGPQLLLTSLYLSGSLPLSAQIGNAISNDGDALFPAIAMAPKAALLATVYSSIPALIVAYSYWWIFE